MYANATLSALLRRPEEWLEGRALEEIEAEAPADPNATNAGVGLRVRLRRSDAVMVECERWAVLLPDGRLALHYRPVPRNAPGALAAAVDRSSGLSTPEHLLEVLRRDWSIAQRDGRSLTIMRFDLDAYRDYHDVFGRGATENVLRLKMGAYGFLRFSIPLLPEAAKAMTPVMLTLSVIANIYGGIICLARTDLKRLIAYSSVSHMGFVTLGIFALNNQGLEGGILQMINHGIVTGGLFLSVCAIYDRTHTRHS